MIKKLIITIFLSLGLFSSNIALAENHDCPVDIKNECATLKEFVDHAIAYLQAHGQAALAVLGDPRGGYREGELYIFVLDTNGIILAHAGNPYNVGRHAENVPNGEKIWRVLQESATADGGWATYEFQNPETNKFEKKHSWVKRVNNMIIGSGLYN